MLSTGSASRCTDMGFNGVLRTHAPCAEAASDGDETSQEGDGKPASRIGWLDHCRVLDFSQLSGALSANRLRRIV